MDHEFIFPREAEHKTRLGDVAKLEVSVREGDNASLSVWLRLPGSPLVAQRDGDSPVMLSDGSQGRPVIEQLTFSSN